MESDLQDYKEILSLWRISKQLEAQVWNRISLTPKYSKTSKQQTKSFFPEWYILSTVITPMLPRSEELGLLSFDLWRFYCAWQSISMKEVLIKTKTLIDVRNPHHHPKGKIHPTTTSHFNSVYIITAYFLKVHFDILH